MILQHRPPLHLTYCLNIHPGESWSDNFAAIKEKALAVKARIEPNDWFGLGLRMSAHAAKQLSDDPGLVEEARDFFAANQLYPFSVNGFPFGRFHSGGVKERVYEPDWRSPERRIYTMQIADVFLNFLPPGVDGSISTVPCSYKPWITDDSDRVAMAKNLAITVAYLAAIHDDTGQEIHLGLEPEPDCYLETTAETIAFFKDALWMDGVDECARILRCDRVQAEVVMRRHLGVCFDTCHVALQFEDLTESLRAYRAEGIRISKVQLSAALSAPNTAEARQALAKFDEPVYLHQVKGRDADGAIYSWYDLGGALEELPGLPQVEELRVHFHVPLFTSSFGDGITSTSSTLDEHFFHDLRVGQVASHLELETYTFDVLPPAIHPGDVVKSISREYAWALDQLGMRH